MTKRFLPPFWPAALIGLAGVAMLVALGVWQIDRMGQKHALLAAIGTRIHAAPVALPGHPDPDGDRYLAVTVSGHFAGQAIYVFSTPPGVGPGYRVVRPFLTGGGRRILVDRGWIRDASGATKPVDPLDVGQSYTLVGNLDWPRETDRYTPAPDTAHGIRFSRDVPAMAKEMNTEPVLLVVASSEPPDAALVPLPVSTAGIPDDHLQYALTWFGLALVWAGMSVYWGAKLRRRWGGT